MADDSSRPEGVNSLAPKSARSRNVSSAARTGGRSRYASRACQECRRRRAKRDGAKPSCSRCLGRELPCVYTTDDDGRGTAPKGYVRLLQARINILERILWLHSIDVDAAVVQLVEQNVIPSCHHITNSWQFFLYLRLALRCL
ncbi:hypothetical protein BBP40_001448 [Aspergillus hancockii]|nr:hypothetical protein BBP40_001448 [Aspergillus hancockii]